MRISCIICAHNEEHRIGAVLAPLQNHPLVEETIVVNDGSSDSTAQVAARFHFVKVISLERNMGKSMAIASGIRASQGELLLFIDADLENLTSADVTALIEPVISGKAGASLSFRGKSWGIYRLLTFDYLTGERVIPKALLSSVLDDIAVLPKYGIEAFMNTLIIRNNIPIAIVTWPHVRNPEKAEKVGFFRGWVQQASMVLQVLRSGTSFFSVLAQTPRLSRLIVSRTSTRFE